MEPNKMLKYKELIGILAKNTQNNEKRSPLVYKYLMDNGLVTDKITDREMLDDIMNLKELYIGCIEKQNDFKDKLTYYLHLCGIQEIIESLTATLNNRENIRLRGIVDKVKRCKDLIIDENKMLEILYTLVSTEVLDCNIYKNADPNYEYLNPNYERIEKERNSKKYNYIELFKIFNPDTSKTETLVLYTNYTKHPVDITKPNLIKTDDYGIFSVLDESDNSPLIQLFNNLKEYMKINGYEFDSTEFLKEHYNINRIIRIRRKPS